VDHTFDAVDEKIAEAEFFLQRMAESGTDMFGFKCYLSAYLSAARTATLALQQFKDDIPGLEAWYAPHRDELKADPIARFLLSARNDLVHGKPNPVSSGRFHRDEAEYFFSVRKCDDGTDLGDVLSTCRHNFIRLLRIVHDCYVQLGVHVDPQQYYTKEHFASRGQTLEQAETEVWGWAMQSLEEEGYDEDDRWHELRSHVAECQINHLFYSYLGKTTPQPVEPEHYEDFAYSPEDKAWDHVPAGFDSLEEYQRHFAIVPDDEAIHDDSELTSAE
jgi:hypothetical protein